MIDYNIFPFTGLEGSIERKEDGTKTLPVFHVNYLTQRPNNNTSAPIRYIRCGVGQADESLNQLDIFILDSDAPHWTAVIDTLSQGTHLCKVDSDKPGRAHFYFKYSPTLPHGKLVLGADRKLELFNGASGVYGVSPANKTKTLSYLAPNIVEPSDEILTLLMSLISPEKNTKATPATVVSERLFYNLLDTDEFQRMMARPDNLEPKFKTFLKLVTPKRYSELADYEGVVHPDKIPDGEGNNYLRDIRLALLQAKDTPPELTRETLVLIGCHLWSKPVSIQSIYNSLKNEKEQDAYEEGAENRTTSIITKYGRQAFIFKVVREGEYWIVELPHSNDLLNVPPVLRVPLRNWGVDCRKWLAQETFIDPHFAKGRGEERKMEEKKLIFKQTSVIKAKHKELDIIKDRTKPGGLNHEHTVYNEYRSSEFLGWMNGYYTLEAQGEVPAYTLSFLNNLAPNKEEFDYLLRFLKTFLTTNWKTAVVLYFLGAGGTGKSTFIKYLTYLVGGMDEMVSPSLKEYLADKNGILFTKTLIVHEEFSKQGNRADFAKVDGMDKAFTGTDVISIRRMYQESYNIVTNGIILKTDNLNSVHSSLDNRRIFSLHPQHKLKDCSWHKGNPMDALLREAPEFARYLLDRVEVLTQAQFNEILFESAYTQSIQLEEYEDDALMQVLLLLAYRRAEDLIAFVRAHSLIYRLELTGRDEVGLTFSTLVSFIRTFESDFTIKQLSYYINKIKETLTLRDASLSKEVAGMPSKRDKRIVLDSSFLAQIKDIVA
ncbi:MAG: hypothetical protein EOM67_03610 [Spirochaetia bacterium]|nr:hypothetical protein [Spirochaetia bacterium]